MKNAIMKFMINHAADNPLIFSSNAECLWIIYSDGEMPS